MDKHLLPSHIQALLFAEGAPITLKKLGSMLGCDQATLTAALQEISQKLAGSGLALVTSDTEAGLVVAADSREAVQAIITAEEERDIGDAGLEVLAILLYEGPSTRATIDYIRGVNSSSTVRTLLTRGLVERAGNPNDGREYVYRATTDLLAHLGVTSKENLPEYATISGELSAFKAQNHGSDSTTGDSAHA